MLSTTFDSPLPLNSSGELTSMKAPSVPPPNGFYTSFMIFLRREPSVTTPSARSRLYVNSLTALHSILDQFLHIRSPEFDATSKYSISRNS